MGAGATDSITGTRCRAGRGDAPAGLPRDAETTLPGAPTAGVTSEPPTRFLPDAATPHSPLSHPQGETACRRPTGPQGLAGQGAKTPQGGPARALVDARRQLLRLRGAHHGGGWRHRPARGRARRRDRGPRPSRARIRAAPGRRHPRVLHRRRPGLRGRPCTGKLRGVRRGPGRAHRGAGAGRAGEASDPSAPFFTLLCFPNAQALTSEGGPSGFVSVLDLIEVVSYQGSYPSGPAPEGETRAHALTPERVDELARAVGEAYARDPWLLPSGPAPGPFRGGL